VFDSISKLLGLGLIVGLIVTIMLYLLQKIRGQKTPEIRKGMFIIAFLILFMLIPEETNAYKLLLELIILAIISSFFLKQINEYNIIKSLNTKKTDIIITGSYLVALLIGLFLIILKSDNIIIIISNIIERIIIFALGVLIATRLLWQKQEPKNNNI